MSVAATTPKAIPESHTQERPFGWWGMLFFLASETFFFANLIASFLYTFVRNGAHLEGATEPDFVLASINTCFLLASSGTIMLASRAMNRGNMGAFKLFLGLTALLGAIFLSGQAWEYVHASFKPQSNVFGSFFYIMTGFHGFHVTAGVVFLLICFFAFALRNRYTQHKHFSFIAAEMYWHFVDVVWVILFSVIYVLPRIAGQ
jgi:cytochrome c oxidase subunit III